MFKGKVEIQIKDAETLEVKNVIEKENSITLLALHNLFYKDNTSFSTSATTTNPAFGGASTIVGSPTNLGYDRNRTIVDANINIGNIDPDAIINEATFNVHVASKEGFEYFGTQRVEGEEQPIFSENMANKTWELTFKGRAFPPTSGQRDINLVTLGGHSRSDRYHGPTHAGFGVLINPSFTQLDNEILDIFYRVTISSNEFDPDDYFWKSYFAARLHPFAFTDYINGTMVGTTSTYGARVIGDIFRGYGKIPERKYIYSRVNTGNAGGSSTEDKNFSQMTAKHSYSYDLTNLIGTTWKTFNFYASRHPFSGITSFSSDSCRSFSHQIFPDDINPVQSIFRHTANAPRPYLEPSYIGNSQAEIYANAPNYELESPNLYRLEYLTGGDVGTATYKFRKRVTMGFFDNKYEHEMYSGKYVLSFPTHGINRYDGSVSEQTKVRQEGDGITTSGEDLLHYKRGLNDWSLYPNVQKYDENRLICADAHGISLLDIWTDDFINFDQYSTPTLTTNSLTDFCVDEEKNIWIATKGEGLFKISNDLQTVTPINIVAGSIVSNNCLSVDFKNNGDVWALFNGGLAKSSDKGVTWTAFDESTPEQFAIPGYTDVNNWNSIRGIVVDKESPDDNFAIVLNDSRNFWWWSRAGSSAGSNITDSTISFEHATGYDRIKDTGGHGFGIRKWIKHFPGTNTFVSVSTNNSDYSYPSYVTYRSIDFMTTTLKASYTLTNPHHRLSNIFLAFEKTSTGIYGLLTTELTNNSTTDIETPANAVTIRDSSLNIIETIGYISSFEGLINVSSGYRSGLENSNTEYMGKGIVFAALKSLPVVYHLLSNKEFNGGPAEHIIWDEYGWNGTAWELNNPNGKITHNTAEELVDGVQVSFANVATPNFEANEFADIHVFKGIHKDNATTLSFDIPYHLRPTQNLTDLESPTIPATTKGLVSNKELNFNTTAEVDVDTGRELYQTEGKIGCIKYSSSVTRLATSEIIFEGDFSISFKTGKIGTNHNDARATFGVAPLADVSLLSFWNNIHHHFLFARNEYQVCNGDTVNGVCAIPATLIGGVDLYTIERVGNELRFKINGAIVHTEAGVTTDPMVAVAAFRMETFRNFFDMNIDYYTENSHIVEMGNSTFNTGVFDPRFSMVESWLSPGTCKVKIGSADAPVNRHPHTPPVSGQATLLPKSGWLRFNAANAGESVEATYQTMYTIQPT